MPEAYRVIARRHLDAELAPLRGFPAPPANGWIRSVREALGMSAADLGARLGVTPQAVQQYEQAEVRGSIRLATLARVAQAMECDVRHAIVPRASLEDIVEQRALALAQRELELVDHSMDLEQQRPGPADNERLITERVRELRSAPGLWRPRGE